MPWHLAPGRVLLGSAAFGLIAVGLIGGLLWWRASERGPRPADETRLSGVLSSPPTAPATFTPAPAASATRPPNSPFPPTATPLPAMIDYIVQSGDTMYAIAFKYNVTLDDILGANVDTLQDVNSLSLGQVLRIPLRDEGEEAAEAAAMGEGDGDGEGDADTAAEAEAAGDAGSDLQEAGAGTRGEVETADSGSDASSAPSRAAASDGEPIVVQEPLTYVVDRGDTLGRVAAEYGVPVEELVRMNDLSGPNALLSIGQSLIVEPAVVETTTPAPTARATPAIFAASDDPGAAAVLPREDAIGPALMASPIPLAPGHDRRIGDSTVTLRWASVGALPSGAFYVVALRSPDEAESETRYEWLRGGGNALRVPATLRPALGAERVVEWTISIRREHSGLLGDERGVLISQAPVWRRFTWAPGAEAGQAATEERPDAVPRDDAADPEATDTAGP